MLGYCGGGCCRQCRKRTRKDGSVEPHLLYLHVEKTGGSSIECATAQTLVPAGSWTNMGHTDQGSTAQCERRCTFDGVKPKRVVSVRDPYAYARSMYLYTWSCEYSDWCRRGYQDWMEFGPFILGAWKVGGHATQSESIRRACGKPCVYDYALRTETLAADWGRLMNATANPLWRLPRSNPTKDGPMGKAPRTIFTKEITDVIEAVEAPLFEQFGYKKRTPPFEIS